MYAILIAKSVDALNPQNVTTIRYHTISLGKLLTNKSSLISYLSGSLLSLIYASGSISISGSSFKS